MTHWGMVYWDEHTVRRSGRWGDQYEIGFSPRARTDWRSMQTPASSLAGVIRTSPTRLTPLRRPSETSWKSSRPRLPSEIAGNRYTTALASRGRRMATTQDEMIAELQRANAELRQEHDSALAREAALSSDLRESLENQTATSDVLKIIARSTLDLQTVLDTLIVTTLRLCNASQGEIWRKDGEVFRHSSSHGSVPAYREIEEQIEIRAGRGTLVGRVALERAPVLITDAWNDPEYEQKSWRISVMRAQCSACHCCATGS